MHIEGPHVGEVVIEIIEFLWRIQVTYLNFDERRCPSRPRPAAPAGVGEARWTSIGHVAPAQALLSDLRERLGSVIQQLKADGVISSWVEPDAMAALLIAAGNGIALQTQLDPEGATAAQLAGQLSGLLLAASTGS